MVTRPVLCDECLQRTIQDERGLILLQGTREISRSDRCRYQDFQYRLACASNGTHQRLSVRVPKRKKIRTARVRPGKGEGKACADYRDREKGRDKGRGKHVKGKGKFANAQAEGKYADYRNKGKGKGW